MPDKPHILPACGRNNHVLLFSENGVRKDRYGSRLELKSLYLTKEKRLVPLCDQGKWEVRIVYED